MSLSQRRGLRREERLPSWVVPLTAITIGSAFTLVWLIVLGWVRA